MGHSAVVRFWANVLVGRKTWSTPMKRMEAGRVDFTVPVNCPHIKSGESEGNTQDQISDSLRSTYNTRTLPAPPVGFYRTHEFGTRCVGQSGVIIRTSAPLVAQTRERCGSVINKPT